VLTNYTNAPHWTLNYREQQGRSQVNAWKVGFQLATGVQSTDFRRVVARRKCPPEGGTLNARALTKSDYSTFDFLESSNSK
jgi:hypothetical protein